MLTQTDFSIKADPLFHITISTHNFAVGRIAHRVRNTILGFARNTVQFGQVRVPGGRYVRAAVKVFGAATQDRAEFRFHINQYKSFIEYMTMNNIPQHLYTISAKEVPLGVSIDIAINDGWFSKPHQVPVVAYLDEDTEYRSKFVELQTGSGKTYSAMRSLITGGKRFVVIIKAGYIKKWEGDITKISNIRKKEIITIQGSDMLKQLTMLGADGLLDCKAIIIGNRTFQNWLKEYEEFKHDTLKMGWGCLPEDFFEVVDAGNRLIDEVHQDFHLNFKIDMYTNIYKSVSLSASLLNNDPFLENMYKIAYPLAERYMGQPLNKYVHAKAIIYSMHHNRHFKTTEAGSTTYSHNAFERSIMKSADFVRSYFELILNTLRAGYFLNYKKGQRALVFCASIDMCAALVKYLKAVYPHLDIRRYCEDDPFENLLQADLCVSTLLSAGTAHDVANLVTVVMSVSVLSLQANIQAIGRLREIVGTRVEFYYLACRDIPKQMEYHMQKTRLLEERALSVQLMNAPNLV